MERPVPGPRRAGRPLTRRAEFSPERRAARDAFVEASEWLSELSSGLTVEQLREPALGEWNLRELVAHASRATSVVEEYFRPSAPEGLEVEDGDPIVAAATYYAGTIGNPRLHAEVAERGRREAALLGEDLSSEVARRVSRAIAIVDEAPETAVFETRFSVMGFAGYLCTRTVELVVHGTDICAAIAAEATVPDNAACTTLAVLAELVRRRGDTSRVVQALGGRAGLPAGFSLFT